MHHFLLFQQSGNVSALVIASRLFRPKRVLTESYSSVEEQKRVLEELQINIEEEQTYLENDPETKAEMASLKILDLFVSEDRRNKK